MFIIRGFAPIPTSFFVLKQRTKQENSSLSADKAGQNDLHRALLQVWNFRQSGQSRSAFKPACIAISAGRPSVFLRHR
jgi:hypothetical protein